LIDGTNGLRTNGLRTLIDKAKNSLKSISSSSTAAPLSSSTATGQSVTLKVGDDIKTEFRELLQDFEILSVRSDLGYLVLGKNGDNVVLINGNMGDNFNKIYSNNQFKQYATDYVFHSERDFDMMRGLLLDLLNKPESSTFKIIKIDSDFVDIFQNIDSRDGQITYSNNNKGPIFTIGQSGYFYDRSENGYIVVISALGELVLIPGTLVENRDKLYNENNKQGLIALGYPTSQFPSLKSTFGKYFKNLKIHIKINPDDTVTITKQ
jgi:hypothetical protein